MARFDAIAVYIMASGRYGSIYIGVTSDRVIRVGQNQAGEGCAFTRQYNRTRLVWYEMHHDMRVTIQREHSMKSGAARASARRRNPKARPTETLGTSPRVTPVGNTIERFCVRAICP